MPLVEFTDNHEDLPLRRKRGILAYHKNKVFEHRQKPLRKTQITTQAERKFETQIKAVAKILDAYGVFEDMPYEKQQRLLRDIVAVFSL